MSEFKITDVSNIAAYGAEWTSEDGYRYQLVSARGSHEMTFGGKSPDSAVWHHYGAVVNPARFGFNGPCRTTREFLAIARNFANSSEGS